MKTLKKIFSVLICLIMVISMTISPIGTVSAAESKRLEEPLYFNGHSYRVYQGICATWEDAKEYCESVGGHLATITSQAENDAVYSYATSLGYHNLYLGLTDKNSSGTWQWVTGEEFVYNNWAPGEPGKGKSEEHYGQFYQKYTSGQWNDAAFGADIEEEKAFLCEWDYEFMRKDIENIKVLEYGGHSYYVLNFLGEDSIEYEDAKEVCEFMGGYLATITSQGESDALYSYIVSCGYLNAYFGLVKEKEEWKWLNGETSNFENWHTGEPDINENNENYGMFYWKFKDGTWNDGNWCQGTIDDEPVFICEWDWVASDLLEECEDSKPFNLKEDGYSFANCNASFGYSLWERLSEDAYISVFGDEGKQLRKSDGIWGGNCFGMSATAVLFREGILDKETFLEQTGSVNNAAATGMKYSLLEEGYVFYVDEHTEIKNLIERYQIWQSSEEGHAWINKRIQEDNSELSGWANILRNYDNYLVSVWWQQGGEEVGHTIVIDSNRKPRNLGKGWFRLYLYDPNNPYCKTTGKKMSNCYDNCQERYLDVNIYTGAWKIDVGVTSSVLGRRVGYDDDGNFIEGSILRIQNYKTLPTSFDGTAKWYYAKDKANTAKLCCANATILDQDKNVIVRIENDELTYLADGIDVSCDVETLDEDSISSRTIELPNDEFTIQFDSQGTAQVFDGEYCHGFVADAGGATTIKPDNSVVTNGTSESTVDVVVERLEENDAFTSVNVPVTNDGINETSISLDTNNELQVVNVEDNFEAKVYSEGQKNEYLISEVSAADVAGYDIAEYALQEGQLVPNDINDASISYKSTYVYDGEEKEFDFAIKYHDETLVLGEDYVVSGVSKGTEVGTYVLVIEGIGTYTGKVEITYQILPQLAFLSATLTLQENFTINYKVDPTLFEEAGYINPYVKFVINDEEVIVDTYREVDGKYVFDCTSIAARQMNDTVYATLYATYGGVEYASEVKEYSIATYCYNVLSKYSSDDNAELRTLMVDILNYGAAAQKYFGYNTDALVDEKLTEEQRTWQTVENPTLKTVTNKQYIIVENPKATWKSAGLQLLNSVNIRLKISSDCKDNLSVKIVSESGQEWIIPQEQFETIEDGYYIYFSGLNAKQMRETIYATVYSGDSTISDTLCYSIESYAYSKRNASDKNLESLVNAMMKYGDSAWAYFNK